MLIVEDIVDSGLTLQYLLRSLGARDPASLEVCALLTKPERRKVDLPTRYVGFEIPNRFAIGYGLDHAERFRNLPYVAALAEPDVRRRSPGIRPVLPSVEPSDALPDPLAMPGVTGPGTRNPPATLDGLACRPTSGAGRAGLTHEQVLQERRLPDPDRGRAGVLRPEADQPGHGDGQADLLALPDAARRRAGQERDDQDQGQHRRRSRADQTARSTRSATPTTTATSSSTSSEANEVSSFDVEGRKSNGWLSLLTYVLPFLIFIGFWIFLMNQVQGGGSKVMSLRQVARQAHVRRLAEDHLPRRRRRRRGRRGAPRDQGVPREPEEVPGARARASPRACCSTGRRAPARRCSRARSPARPACRSSRSPGSDFVEMFVGVGACARARPLRAGQAEQPLHHLHGRDRRRRPPPRRRPRRRSRRARADAQPAARRDGRLRDEGQHHPHRRHQPARHPRPRAAAPGPLRPPDRRRPPRPQGPRQDPRGPHARQAAGQGDRHRRAGRPDPGLHRRRPLQPRQRGRAARRPQRQARDHPGRARGGDHARDRRPGEEDPGHEREGAPGHRLPRDGPRDRRALPASTPTRSTRSRSSPAARRSATRSRCRRRTSSSPPARS